jgi:hypothetical protein
MHLLGAALTRALPYDLLVARLEKLPGWVVSNEESVRREAEPYRHMTPEERLALGAAAARAALEVTLAGPRAAEVLAYRDPLPASSVEALARLRAEHRAKRQ